MKNNIRLMFLVMILIALMISVSINVFGDPVGMEVTSNSSSARNTSPASRADEGGLIVTLVVSAIQQDYAWKAYVGNLTGGLTLDDQDNFTIFAWTLSSYSGEIFATRASNPTWSTVVCANATLLGTESTALNMGVADIDRINLTFDSATPLHQEFTVAGNTLGASTCPTLSPYVNDTVQAEGVDTLFEEIAMYDGTNIIYAAEIEENTEGYHNKSIDFQFIVPDDDTASVQTTYYFYTELDS